MSREELGFLIESRTTSPGMAPPPFITNYENVLQSPVVVAQVSNPSTQEKRQADFCEFKASLVYKS